MAGMLLAALPLPSSSPDWPRIGDALLGPPLRIIGIVIGAVVVRWLVQRAIDRLVHGAVQRADDHERTRPSNRGAAVLAQAGGLLSERHRQRTATLGSLLKSVTTFVVFVLALLTIMAEVGLPLGPLLASAGVGGVALGFGAQSLVKDFLSGIFMIVEDQYGVGDVIDTGEAIGTVEDVTLRVTRLRDGTGVVWYIRNGEITRIANRSQGWSTALVDIPVASSEDLDRVLPLVREAAEEVGESEEHREQILEPPVVAGVQSLSPGVVTVRVTAKCAPNENFGVQRAILAAVKGAFDKAGVRSPSLLPPYGRAPGQGA